MGPQWIPTAYQKCGWGIIFTTVDVMPQTNRVGIPSKETQKSRPCSKKTEMPSLTFPLAKLRTRGRFGRRSTDPCNRTRGLSRNLANCINPDPAHFLSYLMRIAKTGNQVVGLTALEAISGEEIPGELYVRSPLVATLLRDRTKKWAFDNSLRPDERERTKKTQIQQFFLMRIEPPNFLTRSWHN